MWDWCGELQDSKAQLKLNVEKVKEELVAVTEELSQQIAEKEEKMEKAEVRSCESTHECFI